MSWVDPPLKALGNFIAANDWNQDVVDNSKFLHGAPAAKIESDTDRVVDTGDISQIEFDIEIFDTDTMANLETGRIDYSKLEINTSGIYLVSAWVPFSAVIPGGTYFVVWIQTNTGDILTSATRDPTSGTSDWHATLTATVQLSAGQYITLQTTNDMSGLDTPGVRSGTFLAAHWMGSGEATP